MLCKIEINMESVQLSRWRQCRRCKSHRFNPWIRKIPWRRKWQLTSLFLHGKFHGHRNLVGYIPRGRKESDTTDHACIAQHMESVLEETPSLLTITMPARNYLRTNCYKPYYYTVEGIFLFKNDHRGCSPA